MSRTNKSEGEAKDDIRTYLQTMETLHTLCTLHTSQHTPHFTTHSTLHNTLHTSQHTPHFTTHSTLHNTLHTPHTAHTHTHTHTLHSDGYKSIGILIKWLWLFEGSHPFPKTHIVRLLLLLFMCKYAHLCHAQTRTHIYTQTDSLHSMWL